jgi:hypothetical protein
MDKLKIEMEVFDYSKVHVLKIDWENDYKIAVSYEEDSVVITANPDGLKTLARHFLTLAQEDVPSGWHLHYNDYSGLEKDSIGLIIVRDE